MGTWTFAMTNPPGSQQTGDVLVLTTTLRENGAPSWAVIVALATSAAVVLSVLQMIQYWIGVMPSGGPTWTQYRALFLHFP